MTKLLQQALDALDYHQRQTRPIERTEIAIEALKQALAQQEQPASVDAYVGAREDAAIWKKRALEAEELNRKFIAEVNGPTYLGEPVKQEHPAQEPVFYQYRWTNPGDNKDVPEFELDWKTVEKRNPYTDTIKSRIKELKSFRYNGKPCYEIRGLFAAPPTQPAQEPVGHFLKIVRENLCPVYEQVSGEYRTDADVIALYTAPPTQPALSDEEIWQFWCNRPEVPDGEDDSMEAEFVAACKRAIEAHCRGGATPAQQDFPRCTEKLRASGVAYPRTCAECGLGPCRAKQGGSNAG